MQTSLHKKLRHILSMKKIYVMGKYRSGIKPGTVFF